MKILSFLIGATIIAVTLSGCKSDIYYQDAAVNEARGYLLDHSPELSLEEREYVNFTKPALLTSDTITGSAKSTLTSKSGQIAVSWIFPKRDKVYMVVGFSDSRMLSWSPNRLVIKDLTPDKSTSHNTLFDTARKYVYSNLYTNLPVSAATEVRFGEPKLYYSNFPVTATIDPEATVEQQEFLNQMITTQTQFSVVWEWPNGDQFTVVTGYANKERVGFSAVTGGLFHASDLENHLVEPIIISEE